MTIPWRRPLTGVLLAALLAGPSPAGANEGPPGGPHPEPSGLARLPVPVRDVTRSDRSLGSTANEVTVLVTDESGTPSVRKLRADSPAQAAVLVADLDARPGVVAARTTRLHALGAANPEPLASQQWNIAMVGAPDAWPVSRGTQVTVAVIDSGVDSSHPDLAGRVLPEIDLLPDVTPRLRETDHGTRVASLVAARVNSMGMAGVAPDVDILPIAALDGSGVGDSSTVARAIIAAADAGARVINLSLGGPDPDPVLDSACAYAHAQGSIVVAAAGNSHLYGNEAQYPAASPNVVAVGAVDSTGARASFSNTGPYLDLVAPGQDVLAAIHGGRYDRQSGTSFAAPHVSGTLAIVAAANPELSAPEVVALTQLTAQDDSRGNGRDRQYGYGLVRADRAADTAQALRRLGIPMDIRVRPGRFNARPEPIVRGEVATFTAKVRALFPDGVWRASPVPVEVFFQFKRKDRRYRTVAVVASTSEGRATLRKAPRRSGWWRARVKRPGGGWQASRADFLKVRPRR